MKATFSPRDSRRTSTFTTRALAHACRIETLERRIFLAIDVPAGYVKLDTLSFDAIDSDATAIPLEAGVQYYFKTSSLWLTSAYNAENYDPSGVNQDTVSGIDVGVKLTPQTRSSSMLPRWENNTGQPTVFSSRLTGTGAPVSLRLVTEPLIQPPSSGGTAQNVELWGPKPHGNPPAPVDTGGLTDTEFGADGGLAGDENRNEAGVRYSDGSVDITATDLSSSGFGMEWGQTRTWSNRTGGAHDGPNGNGWIIPQRPYIKQITSTDVIAVVTGGGSEHTFTKDGTDYWAGGFSPTKLTWDSANDEFIFRDSTGRKLVFYDFDATATARRGQFKSMTDSFGNTTTVTSWSSDKPAEIQRSSGSGSTTKIESWQYAYVASGDNAGLIEKVTLRRSTDNGSNWTVVREVVYAYYGSGDDDGLVHDLKTVTLYDGASSGNQVIDKSYFRYYTTNDTGKYQHGLRLAFGPRSYARLAANVSDIDGASDSTIEKYADHKFTYNADKQVATHVTQRKGSSSASSPGLGTFSFTYSTSSDVDYNLWKYKVVETLPATTSGDNGTNTVYLNAYGQTLLKVFQPNGSSDKWATYYKYDGSGRLLETAEPSAVTTSTDGTAVLTDGGTSYYTRASSGLIRFNTYATATTATESTAGNVAGYLQSEGVKKGRTDASPATLREYTYILHDNVDGSYSAANPQIRPLASVKVHKTAGDGGQTTTFTYDSWHTNSLQKKQVTTSYAAIAEAQNGPVGGSTSLADTVVKVHDSYGRVTWTRDGEGSTYDSALGYIKYAEYDNPTGAVVRTITDVNTSTGSGYSDLPSGWTTRSGGGLHIRTDMSVDGLGRVTKSQTLAGTSPSDTNDRVTYTVYKDVTRETRVYPGFYDAGSSTFRTTGPIRVSREYRPAAGASSGERTVYVETLTTSANPGITSSKPDGSETISAANIQTLERSITNDGNQVVGIDRYYSMSGVTYATAMPQLGSSGNDSSSGNYHATTFGYNDRGWLNRRLDPTGTITATTYDQLGRATAKKIGTNDGGSSNMVTVEEYVYDAAGVGDGNMTKLTRKPGGSASDRVTIMSYDWRNRLVYRKDGAEASESSSMSVQRPIFYFVYNNLDQVTERRQYDGDDVNGNSAAPDANTDGVPDAPTSGLVAQSDTLYDDRLRPYQDKKYIIISGATGSALTTNYFYDRRGNIVATKHPGGLTSKSTFDGAGRLSKTFSTSFTGDWFSAAGPSSFYDKVLAQVERQYDVDGNVILEISKDRFHDATAAGELGNKTTNPKARVSYVKGFFDNANRLTVAVNEGTFGSASYTPITGTATSSGSTTTLSDTARTEAEDFFVGYTIAITGGKGAGQKSIVTDFNATTDTFTFSPAFDLAPDTTSKYVVTKEGLATSHLYSGAGWPDVATDPRNVVDKTFYDMRGRVTKTIEGYTDGTPSATDDRTTEYTYDGNDHVLLLKATLPSSTYQKTQYVYGVTGDIYSNDLIAEVRYPDKDTGDASPSSANKEVMTYNALGERKTLTDRNGSVHTYDRDVVSRLTHDRITTLGSGVNGDVRRLSYTYDTAGRPEKFTSYDNATVGSGSVVNEVQRVYNGLGQLTEEYQAHDGAVNTGSSPKVIYTYSEMASGANHSRLTKMKYPDTRELHYRYGSTGLDNDISRVKELASAASSGTVFEAYSYLGLDTIVIAAHEEPDVDLRYARLSTESDNDGTSTGGGDQYTGLDRFGRISRQRYYDTVAASNTDDFIYGYDRNGNRLYRDNVLTDSLSGSNEFDELYHADDADPSVAYDKLDRLIEFQRGELSDGDSDGNKSVTTSSRTQVWTFDASNNWDYLAQTGGGSDQDRTHDKQNQITGGIGGSPSYDNNGNFKGTSNNYTFDAWNRFVLWSAGSGITVTFEYDALQRRIQRLYYDPGVGFAPIEENEGSDYYYTHKWQIIEEHINGQVLNQFVWSERYVNAPVLRDRDADFDTGNGLEERLYYQSDANFNVTALIETDGDVVERLIYDPYGAPSFRDASWGSASTFSAYNNDVLFQGGKRDVNTGLVNFQMRDLSTGLGRWVQADPLGYVDGMNLYEFVVSNPVNGLDPDGLRVVWSIGPGGNAEMAARASDLWDLAKTRRKADGSKPTGVQNLENIEDDPDIVVVVEVGNDPSEYEPEQVPRPNRPIGGKIKFNPDEVGKYDDGAEKDPESTLVHEATHAEHGRTGKLQARRLEEVKTTQIENEFRLAKGGLRLRRFYYQYPIVPDLPPKP